MSVRIIQRLENLKKGDVLVYYTGYLAEDKKAKDIAEAAHRLFEKGRVYLTQRRVDRPMHGPNVDWRLGKGTGFQYIATGR